MEIHDCEQRSEEWFRLRAGLPTASKFSTIMAAGKDGGASKTRRKYMLQLAGEILTKEPAVHYSNMHMERGRLMEDEARKTYAFMCDDETVTPVGFIRNGSKGCSPDSLVGADGLLEIKTALPEILIEIFFRDEFPPEHKPQCQGALWVAERAWIDIAIYWPKMPMFMKRAYRDEPYIQKLSKAVDEFNKELAATVERMRPFIGLAA